MNFVTFQNLILVLCFCGLVICTVALPAQTREWDTAETSTVMWRPQDLALKEMNIDRKFHSPLAICVFVTDAWKEACPHDWINFHTEIGIEKIYMYDRSVKDPILEYILNYTRAGIVEYSYMPEYETDERRYAHDRCLRDFGERHTFMAFPDFGEYMIPRVANLTLALQRFKNMGGVAFPRYDFQISSKVGTAQSVCYGQWDKYVTEQPCCERVNTIQSRTIVTTARASRTTSMEPQCFQTKYQNKIVSPSLKFEYVDPMACHAFLRNAEAEKLSEESFVIFVRLRTVFSGNKAYCDHPSEPSTKRDRRNLLEHRSPTRKLIWRFLAGCKPTTVPLAEDPTFTALVAKQNKPAQIDLDGKFHSYFAMCLIAKDEKMNIVEWVKYHVKLGTKKIYIFENDSGEPMLNTILPLAKIGLIEYTYLRRIHSLNQLYTWDRCLREFGPRHGFMSFIDVDEFIVVKDPKKNIPQTLKPYEPYGALSLNWMMFGNSGHMKRPGDGVLDHYTKCFPVNTVKPIVRTAHVAGITQSPHHFAYKEGYYGVDTAMKPSLGRVHPPCIVKALSPRYPVLQGCRPPSYLFDTMYLNHYVTKSYEDFSFRLNTRGDVTDRNWAKTWDFYYAVNNRSIETCPVLKIPHH